LYQDLYKVLNVSPDASERAIKSAYRTCAKKHHPDLNQGCQTAERLFKAVGEAYEVLGNADQRRSYDAFRVKLPLIGWGNTADKCRFSSLGFQQKDVTPTMYNALQHTEDFLCAAYKLVQSTSLMEVVSQIWGFVSAQSSDVCILDGLTYTVRFIRVALSMLMGSEITIVHRDEKGRVCSISVETDAVQDLCF
jgi:hypothetical protein